jgi:hypothetical protein
MKEAAPKDGAKIAAPLGRRPLLGQMGEESWGTLLACNPEQFGATGRALSCERLATILEGHCPRRGDFPVLLLLHAEGFGHHDTSMIRMINKPETISLHSTLDEY